MIQNSSPRIDVARNIRKNWHQCVSKCVCSVVVMAAMVSPCVAIDEPKTTIQQRVTGICQNLQSVTVRVRSGKDLSSGVIVSKSGLVLTVAHGLMPGSDTATVVFSDGNTIEAQRVVVDNAADVALLLIDVASLTDVAWSAVSVPTGEVSMVGEVVLANGFPAREPDGMGAVLRLGEILAVDGAAVKTSCTLTTGDSGGPLVNSRGELIGLHRQIGVGAESNGHVAVTAIHAALEKSSHWMTVSQGTVVRAAKLPSKDLTASRHLETAVSRATAAIHGTTTDGNSAVRVLGTVLDDYHVATKLSEIVPCQALKCQFADGSTIAATLSKSNLSLDLAILKLASPYIDGKTFSAADSDRGKSELFRSQLVFAATSQTNVSAVGIIGRIPWNEPAQPARFGATMEANADRLRITGLSPNGSAVLAGLQVGDELREIDGEAVTSLKAAGDLLKSRQPGDWISIDAVRAMMQFSVQAQLQHDPGQQFEKTEFLDGRAGRVNQRRSGFQSVLQHDIALDPVACCGPLFDIEGHVIAINIARRARESTLAIPIKDVFKAAGSRD